jgi:O-antigen/teichoic acid export membrane protein
MIVSIFFTFLNNLFISGVVDKLYPQIKCSGSVTSVSMNNIRKKVAGLFVGKLCGITRNTFDIIFVSMFIGLIYAGIYSNYYYVLVAATSFTSIITTSLLAGIGNSIVLESKEKNYRDMMLINKVYLVIGGWITACMLCLFQPFMELWMGKEFLFPDETMILFPIYFYIQKMGDVRGVYSDAIGLFWENRWRNILEAIANIALNYLFVIKFGVFGIVLATIITLFFIGFLGSTQVIFNHYFEYGMKEYLLSQLKYLVFMVIVCCIAYFLCLTVTIISPIITCFFRASICITLVPIVYWLLLNKSEDYKDVKKGILKVIK